MSRKSIFWILMAVGLFTLPAGLWFWCVAYFVWPRKKSSVGPVAAETMERTKTVERLSDIAEDDTDYDAAAENNRDNIMHNIREWTKSGVIKTLVVNVMSRTPCEYCKSMNGKEFSIYNQDDMKFVMQNAVRLKGCAKHCGCCWRPEKIDIE